MAKKTSKRRIEDYALFLIVGGLYAFAVNLSILTTTIVQVPLWSLFLVGLGILLLFALIFYNRYTMLGALGFLVFVGMVLYWIHERMEDFWYFVNEIILLTQGYIAFRPEFTWPVVLAVCLLTGLFIAICLYVNFHFYMLAGFGAAIFIISWLMDYPQSLFGFVIYLFCFCVFLVRKLQGKTGDGTRAALITAPLCALVVWLVTAVPVPTVALDNATINRILNEPWEVVSEFIFLTFNPMYFSFQTTGFAGHGGRLGGPVSPNHRPVMSVSADRRIYLSGATHNIYTGYGWTSDTSEFVPTYGAIHPSYIEFLETANALFRYTSRAEITGDRYHLLDIISYLPLSYTDIFLENRTGSLFRPMRERGIVFDNPNLNYLLTANASGDRRLRELLPRHTIYHYNFLDLDYREEHIQDILRSSRRGIHRERLENHEILTMGVWENDEIVGELTLERMYQQDGYMMTIIRDNDIVARHRIRHNTQTYEDSFFIMGSPSVRNFMSLGAGNIEGLNQFIETFTRTDNGTVRSLSGFTIESPAVAVSLINKVSSIGQDALLAEYADFVYARYTSLPYTLPQRVIDLAHDITRYYDTDYDRIRALQEYLIQFPYTLTPGHVPRDRDFVDYFLFDGQEGYCVYYASAMVVMTRAIGLPARYVEGFLLPAARDAETGRFNVTNRNAHAWAEVYLEGFGWLIVETTSPYVFAMYERPVFAAHDIFAWGFGWHYEDYLREMGLWYAFYGLEGWDGEWDLMPDGIFATDTQEQVPINLWALAFATAVAIPGMLITYLAVWHILWLLRLYKINKMNPNDKAINYYREILKITDYWRYPLLGDETSFTYGQRIRYRFSFVNDTVFIRDLNEIYYRARYGGETLTEKEAAFMKNCYYELVKYALDVRGLHNFIYIRYIKGIIAL